MHLRRSSFALAAAVVLAACGGSGPDAWAPPLPVIHGSGGVWGTYAFFAVTIHADRSYRAPPVSDATVTLNGTTELAWDPVSSSYKAPAFEPLPDQELVLTVEIPEGSLVAAGTYSVTGKWFAALPTITSPIFGSTRTGGEEIVVTWDRGAPSAGTPAPVYYVGLAEDWGSREYPDAYPLPLELPTSATSYTLPAGTLPAGDYTLYLGIGTPGLWGASAGIPIAGAAEGSDLALHWTTGFSHRFTVQ